MGAEVANQYFRRHIQRIGNIRVAVQESQIGYHYGNAGIDRAWLGTLNQTDLEDLHAAALINDHDFGVGASTIFGTWWDDLCADATTANIDTDDHPVAVFRSHYAQATSVPV